MWGVCEPTTGELLAEVRLDPGTAVITSRARSGHHTAAGVATQAVARFAAGALGLAPVVAPGGTATAGQYPADPAAHGH